MKHLTQLLLVLAVVNALGGAGLWYGFTIMKEKKDSEIQLRADIAEEGQKWKKLAVLRRTLVLAEKDRTTFSKYFSDSSEESQIKFINDVEQLGGVTGVAVKTEAFDFSRQEPKSFHGTFSLTGSWEQLYHMLRLMEEYPGRMVINRFDAKENAPTAEYKNPYWVGALSVELMSIKSTE